MFSYYRLALSLFRLFGSHLAISHGRITWSYVLCFVFSHYRAYTWYYRTFVISYVCTIVMIVSYFRSIASLSHYRIALSCNRHIARQTTLRWPSWNSIFMVVCWGHQIIVLSCYRAIVLSYCHTIIYLSYGDMHIVYMLLQINMCTTKCQINITRKLRAKLENFCFYVAKI